MFADEKAVCRMCRPSEFALPTSLVGLKTLSHPEYAAMHSLLQPWPGSCIPVIIPWRSASELDALFSPTPCSVFVALPLGKEDKLSRIDQVVLAT